MLIYSHWSPRDRVPVVEEHVRAHLSSIVNAEANELASVDEVRIELRPQDGGVLVVGAIDGVPQAPYLDPDFDTLDDIRNNPLSVPSILDGEL